MSFAQQSIIGGVPFNIKDAPYQVSLANGNGPFCGGVIIADKWVLTAGHCLSGRQPSSIFINAGVTDNTDLTTGQVMTASQFFIHPNFYYPVQNPVPEFDLALIELDSAIKFNYSAMPVEYINTANSNAFDLLPGIEALITGWGDTSAAFGIQPPNFLRGTKIPIIPEGVSQTLHFQFGFFNVNLDSNKISFFELGKSSGRGDSGGPAVINKNGNLINVGVTSFGFQPDDSLPSVYVNLIQFQDWIDSITGINNNPSRIDLYIKDKPWDMGQEPFTNQYPWTSDDIWVRNTNDSIEVHQDPEFSTGSNPNYIKVRVTNNGSIPSVGNEKLKVYWAKAATALTWPNHWNGSLSVAGQPLGDSIGTVTLPVIQPGDAYIATIPWLPPNPTNFVGLSSNPIFFANEPHHFCLLARIESIIDTMTQTETSSVAFNTIENNNIAWKNLSVVDNNLTNITSNPSAGDVPRGAKVIVGSVESNLATYDLEFANVFEKYMDPITAFAEVRVTLDEVVWNNWIAGGQQSENIEIVNVDEQKLKLTNSSGRLKNISFQPEEFGLVHTSFNFLTDEIDEENNFQFTLIQTESGAENKLIGGELFEIRTPNRSSFDADAGQDEEIEEGDSITLNALKISENAIYNWYNQEGDLIHTGSDFTVTPDITQTYTLEVIATADGFKDYDEIEVSVNEYRIESIAPNPATTNLTVHYDAEGATSAYLVLVKLQGNQSNQFILNTSISSTTINVSGLQSGNYSLILVCNGIVQDFTNLIIQ